MISRLTALALGFAVLATGSLALAASAYPGQPRAVAEPVPVVQLERVVISAQRLPQPAR